MQMNKTLVAVLAGHDSVQKNNELARTIEDLYRKDEKLLGQFHFLVTGGTFSRLMLGKDTQIPSRINDTVKHDPEKITPLEESTCNFIRSTCGVTVLPGRKENGVIILANLIVQHQCGIVWPFFSPITSHWLNPENQALLRLSDLWNVKRLMNGGSVKDWFCHEAARDVRRNLQQLPLKIALGSPEKDQAWPHAERTHNSDYFAVALPKRSRLQERFWTQFSEESIALIAHDEMKQRMIDFAVEYEDELRQFRRILATGGTGQEVENACRRLREEKKIRRYLSGPKGGDIQIATEILFNRCNIVIFFIDPLHPHPHIDDIRAVVGACMAEIQHNNVRILTNEVHAREWMEETVRRCR
jgi:methylglyoxal synthase